MSYLTEVLGGGGLVGPVPEHEVDAAQARVRFRQPDGAWGAWLDAPNGPQGPQGDPGPQGPVGPQGPEGPNGALTFRRNGAAIGQRPAVNFIPTQTAGGIDFTLTDDAGGGEIEVRGSLPAGTVIARASAVYTAYGTFNTVIPADNTVPQITEGTQILSISHATRAFNSGVRLTYFGNGSGAAPVHAMFRSGSTNALRAIAQLDGDLMKAVVMQAEYLPGSTASVTYSIRVGAGYSGGVVYVNGLSSGQVLGGAQAAVLLLEEFVGL